MILYNIQLNQGSTLPSTITSYYITGIHLAFSYAGRTACKLRTHPSYTDSDVDVLAAHPAHDQFNTNTTKHLPPRCRSSHPFIHCIQPGPNPHTPNQYSQARPCHAKPGRRKSRTKTLPQNPLESIPYIQTKPHPSISFSSRNPENPPAPRSARIQSRGKAKARARKDKKKGNPARADGWGGR
ncbi:hypothetical protein EYC84_007584 [Monilinia fructicola]|uniref:Uncharacterized protein n=1 Tax=Monilinia fructicola TaxID=38448 RepID=A0A5M9JLE6_MONFR|nr:hypothetical protein EYC84_007584 [Monilinia fructicola]